MPVGEGTHQVLDKNWLGFDNFQKVVESFYIICQSIQRSYPVMDVLVP